MLLLLLYVWINLKTTLNSYCSNEDLSLVELKPSSRGVRIISKPLQQGPDTQSTDFTDTIRRLENAPLDREYNGQEEESKNTGNPSTGY